MSRFYSRRDFLRSTARSALLLAGTLSLWPRKKVQEAQACSIDQSSPNDPDLKTRRTGTTNRGTQALRPFCYDKVVLTTSPAQRQFEQTMATLLAISDDTMLKPFRLKTGLPTEMQPPPGTDLGGWYDYSPDYDWHGGNKNSERGFAPGHCFGQWLSALARAYATTGDTKYKDKVDSLVTGYAQTISPRFYQDLRFPAYTYDKIVGGLIDAHTFGHCKNAANALDKTTEVALPFLPATALEREAPIAGRDVSYTWDESYTLPENLYIAYQRGFGEEYLLLAERFLLDKSFFDVLAAGQNKDILEHKHAYSYMNALSSAMQAYLSTTSPKHLRAAQNGFDLVVAQSYATGGWGPDEQFHKDGSDALFESLTKTHNSFETPCGAYAHLKLTRYLTMVAGIKGGTRYADSAERIIHNTVLGAKPLQTDGHAFYYSDYNTVGSKIYSNHGCPCCAGTLAQVSADYGINTYFQDAEGLTIAQYINSEVTFDNQGHHFRVSQESRYPQNGTIKISILKGDGVFNLRLRIPGWADPSKVKVSFAKETMIGEPAMTNLVAGQFAEIKRHWRQGEIITLNLPMELRLEPIDARHPDTVALLCGPRVLFAVGATDLAASGDLTASSLLSATPDLSNHSETWQTADGKLQLMPFTAIGDEQYSTYLKVSVT